MSQDKYQLISSKHPPPICVTYDPSQRTQMWREQSVQIAEFPGVNMIISGSLPNIQIRSGHRSVISNKPNCHRHNNSDIYTMLTMSHTTTCHSTLDSILTNILEASFKSLKLMTPVTFAARVHYSILRANCRSLDSVNGARN